MRAPEPAPEPGPPDPAETAVTAVMNDAPAPQGSESIGIGVAVVYVGDRADDLTSQFFELTHQRLRALVILGRRLASGYALLPDVREAVTLAHKIKGMAGPFGYPALSRIAGRVEGLIKPFLGEESFPPEAGAKVVAELTLASTLFEAERDDFEYNRAARGAGLTGRRPTREMKALEPPPADGGIVIAD